MSSIVEFMRNWWLPLLVGLTVSSLVYRFSGYIPFLPRRGQGLAEDNLPWGTLLELLKTRYRERGNDLEDDMDPDDLLHLLMDKVPNLSPRSVQDPHTLEELRPTGRERRTSRRRWANPIEVRLVSAQHQQPQHGLVINRSAGGLAILTNVPFPPDSVLFVYSVEAPEGTPAVKVAVRHSRALSKLCFMGCQYLEELPWNLKVWFG